MTERPIHVLMVGPDVRQAELLAAELVGRGIRIEPVRGIVPAGPSADPPDAVLVDSRPDARKSLATITRLRATLPETTAILWFIGSVRREDVLRAVEVGASGVVLRPVAIPAFLNSLAEALARCGHPRADRVASRESFSGISSKASETLEEHDRVESLRAVPVVVERILSITRDDEAGARDLADIIRADLSTTAVVLKRANSPLHGLSRKIHDVQQAIALLGFQRVRSIVLGLSVIRNFDGQRAAAEFDPAEFWRFSIASAILGRRLADHLGLGEPETAFIAGLLHGIGQVVCQEHLGERFRKAVRLAHDERVPLHQAARAVLGIDDAAIGQRLLERWRFPEPLVWVAGVRTLADLDRIEAPDVSALARLIWLADSLARSLGLGCPVDRFVEAPEGPFLDAVGLGQPLPDSFYEEAVVEVRETWQDFGYAPIEQGRIAAADPATIRFYAQGRPTYSPLEGVIRGVGAACQRLGSGPAIAEAPPEAPVVVQCSSLEGLLAIHRAVPDLADRHSLLLLPADQLPLDDAVKRHIGLPVGRCRYLVLPEDARVLAEAVGCL